MPRRSSSSATHPTKRRTSNEPHSPGSSIGIDQLKHDFVKSCTPALEQFQLDQNVQRAEAAVKQKYCMMHGLSTDEVTVSSSEDEHGVRTFTITETPSTQMVGITFTVPTE